MRSPVLRFAPSPNGLLHLGHAYSALCNERIAAETNGRLLLRIEDLDRARCKTRYEAAIEEDLAWLGLRFEAPARRQSEHEDDYAGAFDRLAERRLAYPCFCTRAEVARASRSFDPDGASVYSGACRALTPGNVAARIARGANPAWRLDMRRAIGSPPQRLLWTEFGERSNPVDLDAEPERWGDVVLRGRDLAASYHLAVTVDDALQGVTDVVRGRDLLAATSVHRLLQELLDLPSPRYRHHRLVLDPEGAKLAKRRHSPTLTDLRARGVSSATVRAALGFGGGDSEGLSVALS
jgi:glutamyl-Q tRNA(Asp) synthetase